MNAHHISYEKFAVAGPFDAVALSDTIFTALEIPAGALVQPGGVSVIVTEALTRDGNSPRITVSDGGTGMSINGGYVDILGDTEIAVGIDAKTATLTLGTLNQKGKHYIAPDVLLVQVRDKTLTGTFSIIMRYIDLADVLP